MDIEFNFARTLNDRFWMIAILGKSVFQRLIAVNEQATEHAVLFSGNPVATTISANENDRRYGIRLHGEFNHSARTVCSFHDNCPLPKDVRRCQPADGQ